MLNTRPLIAFDIGLFSCLLQSQLSLLLSKLEGSNPARAKNQAHYSFRPLLEIKGCDEFPILSGLKLVIKCLLQTLKGVLNARMLQEETGGIMCYHEK